MKSALRLVLFVLFAISVSSCFTIYAISRSQRIAREQGKYFGSDSPDMDLKTFQRIAGHAALATTGKGDVVCVVAKMDDYYDGMVISGRFTKKGTYSYTASSGANRTVLVYVYEKDREELEKYVEDFLKENPNVIVDSNSSLII